MEVGNQLYALPALPPEKSPWYPFDRRLGRPQSQCGCGVEDKSTPAPAKSGNPVVRPIS